MSETIRAVSQNDDQVSAVLDRIKSELATIAKVNSIAKRIIPNPNTDVPSETKWELFDAIRSTIPNIGVDDAYEKFSNIISERPEFDMYDIVVDDDGLVSLVKQKNPDPAQWDGVCFAKIKSSRDTAAVSIVLESNNFPIMPKNIISPVGMSNEFIDSMSSVSKLLAPESGDMQSDFIEFDMRNDERMITSAKFLHYKGGVLLPKRAEMLIGAMEYVLVKRVIPYITIYGRPMREDGGVDCVARAVVSGACAKVGVDFHPKEFERSSIDEMLVMRLDIPDDKMPACFQDRCVALKKAARVVNAIVSSPNSNRYSVFIDAESNDFPIRERQLDLFLELIGFDSGNITFDE